MHQHLCNLSKFQLPWLNGNPTLDRSLLMSDYLKATEGLNILSAEREPKDVRAAVNRGGRADDLTGIIDAVGISGRRA